MIRIVSSSSAGVSSIADIERIIIRVEQGLNVEIDLDFAVQRVLCSVVANLGKIGIVKLSLANVAK